MNPATLKKTVAWILIGLTVGIFVGMILGKVKPLLFWAFIIVLAIIAFKVFPKWNVEKK